MSRSKLLSSLNRLLGTALYQEQRQLSDQQLRSRLDSLEEQFSRRRFLQGAGLASLALPLAVTAPSLMAQTQRRDIVIVGAGTAGLTAAYYLAKAGLGSMIYEGSSRHGGRMFTAQNFNEDKQFCELGGEFVDTQHKELLQLCAEINLPVDDRSVDPKFPSKEIFYSQGKVRSSRQVITAFKPLAKKLLKDRTLLMVAGEVAIPTYNSPLAANPLVQALDRTSLAEYLEAAKIDSWLLDLIGSAYVGEYGLDVSQQSALNLIVLISADTGGGFKIFGSSDEAKRIRGGSEALPAKLAKTLSATVPIEYEHRLLAVEDQKTQFKLIFDQKGTTVEVQAQRLILAVPAPMLKEIDLTNLQLNPVKRQAIEAWGFGSNSKLMLGFQKRTWERPGTQRGFSILPDRVAHQFWDTSLGQSGTRGIVTNFLGGANGKIISANIQSQSLDFLETIFPGTRAAFDNNKILQHWPSQKLTRGSYTCSKPGQYTTVYGAFAEAELNGRLCFAGEHCSTDWSGYMNGAVQSGKQAADLLLARV